MAKDTKVTTFNKDINIEIPEGVTDVKLGINIAITSNTGGGGGGGTSDLVLQLTIPADDSSFIINTANVGVFDGTIDWGDGSTSTITAFDDAAFTHVYETAGSYELRMSGTFPVLRFDNLASRAWVTKLDSLGSIGLTTCDSMFWLCGLAGEQNFGSGDVSGITSMRDMFGLSSADSVVARDLSFDSLTSIRAMCSMYANGVLASVDFSGSTAPNLSDLRQTFNSARNLSYVRLADMINSASGTMTSFNMMSGAFVNTTVDIDIASWNPDKFSDLSALMASGVLPTSVYDTTLIAWDDLPASAQTVNFGISTYSSAAVSARSSLVSDGWEILDGGAV